MYHVLLFVPMFHTSSVFSRERVIMHAWTNHCDISGQSQTIPTVLDFCRLHCTSNVLAASKRQPSTSMQLVLIAVHLDDGNGRRRQMTMRYGEDSWLAPTWPTDKEEDIKKKKRCTVHYISTQISYNRRLSAVNGPTIWNNLPAEFHPLNMLLHVFRKCLKNTLI